MDQNHNRLSRVSPATFDLSGKLVMVSGASSGIGLHLAGAMAQAGADVVLCARRLERVQQEAERLRTQEGVQLAGIALDVSSVDSIDLALQQIREQFHRVPDVLINCAGVAVLKPFLEQTPEELDTVLNVNLRGAFLLAQRVAAAMVDQGGGSIINVASTAGIRPGGFLSSYGASKAGLIHLSKVMAFELARHKVRVNALCPGNIETDMHRDFEDAGFAEALVKRIPQRRFGTSQDLVGVALLLASEASSYMTGSVLTVDGGQTVNSL